MINKFHYYRYLGSSSWPLLCSICLLFLPLGFLSFIYSPFLILVFILSFFIMVSYFFLWWSSISKEYCIVHYIYNFESLVKSSFFIFILTEVILFFSFFWSYFHFMLTPIFDCGISWPPNLIIHFFWFSTPLLNSLILLFSRLTVTISHFYIGSSNMLTSFFFLLFTIVLGVLFTFLQLIEYNSSFFCISDGVFSCSFFSLTGLHGFHVIVGTLFLIVTIFRFNYGFSSRSSHMCMDLRSIYWHFVDVVWVYLFYIIYFLYG